MCTLHRILHNLQLANGLGDLHIPTYALNLINQMKLHMIGLTQKRHKKKKKKIEKRRIKIKSNQIKFLFYFCFRDDDHALSKHLKNMFQAHGLKIKVNTKGKNTLFLACFLLYHNHTLLLTSSKNKWKSWLLLQNMRVWLSVCNMK